MISGKHQKSVIQMQIKNSRAWAPNTPVSYGYALLATGAAFFVRYELHPLMQAQLPVLFFIFSSTLIAYNLGWKPAALSSALGLTSAYFFFKPPFNSFEMPSNADLVNLIVYITLFVTVLYLIEKLQRERYPAILIARVSDSRLRIMSKLSARKRS
jgi:K+-sensing histidine kinase KdpD